MALDTQKPLAREAWVSACAFHPSEQREVLNKVLQQLEAHPRPVVLLDLDSTLYCVAHRSHQIIQDWVEQAPQARPEVCRALSGLDPLQVGYSLQDTFTTVGLSLADAGTRADWETLKAFWWERFFSDDYLPYDQPYPGAVDFVRQVQKRNAEIIYLTGREKALMLKGTVANLVRDQFPWGDQVHLLMKERSDVDDLSHKREVATFIRGRGTLVASFENEPQNLAALYEIFPEALHVFVDTVCSDHPAPVCQGIYRIQGF